jgi:hypothetical protein
MTITVTAPNGATVQFPDGTDHATINGVMMQHFKAETKPEPDKYQQAAIDEDKAIGGAPTAGFTRRLTHGATLGADSTILAGLETPLEMVKRGTIDPREGYNYAKAREDLIMNKSRENTGIAGTAVEALGGAVSAGGLAKAGVTAARALPEGANLFQRSLASAADAAGIGGFSGTMEGDGLKERAINAAKGLLAGGAVGYLAPGVVGAAKAVVSPVISQVLARLNPKNYAEAQIARALSEGKITPAQIEAELARAADEGQGVYTVADAMGNSGQRMLSTVTRSPGQARTDVVAALDSRQGDQGRRLSGALREGFDAPQTAEQTRAAMAARASNEANANYAPVKAETNAIDVSEPVAVANRAISPAADNLATARGAVPTDLAARAGIEGAESALRDPIANSLKEARSYLAAPNLTASNVGQAFRAKVNIDQMIAKATENGQGALVGELMPIKQALDQALARSSQSYAGARDAYRLAQQRIEALDLGKTLGSKPVRPEDAIRQFSELPDAEAQTAFRVGYADPQISQVQNAAFGTNKARPFTSDAVKQEFDAFAAPGKAETLQRQIGRENTMFQTRNQAMGGSKTVDNLNDDAAMAVSPEVIGVLRNVISGNFGGAVTTAIAAGKNGLTGNTAAVRQEVANILLQSGRNIPAGRMQDMVDEVLKRALHVAKVAESAGRGVMGGALETVPGQRQRRQ